VLHPQTRSVPLNPGEVTASAHWAWFGDELSPHSVAALNAGDTKALRSLGYSAEDRSAATSMVSAYSKRTNRIRVIEVDEMGGQVGVLNIVVPCQARNPDRDRPVQLEGNELVQFHLADADPAARHRRCLAAGMSRTKGELCPAEAALSGPAGPVLS
jgi:hypothetical protein